MDTTNIFSNTAVVGDQTTEPSSGGASAFTVPETNGYSAVIKHAYVEQNRKNPKNTDIKFRFELSNGFIWDLPVYAVLVNGSPYQAGKKVATYGFSQATRIIGCAAGISLEEAYASIADVTLMLYDFQQGKEVPTPVKSLATVVGKDLVLGLTRKIQNKSMLDEATGEWVNLPEKKTVAVLSQTATNTGLTLTEHRSGATEAKAFPEWTASSAGKDWDAYVPVVTAGAPTGGVEAGAVISFS